MLVALLLASIAVLGGTLLTFLFDDDAPLSARLCSAVPVGFAALAFFALLAAYVLPFNEVLLLCATLACASPAVLLWRRTFRAVAYSDVKKTALKLRAAVLHPDGNRIFRFVFYVLIGLLLWAVFGRVLFVKADGLYTGITNNVGDLPFHLQIIASFVHGHNFPPDDPTYAGSRFTYPFLADLIAALFVRAGASLRAALLIENLLLALALVGLIHRLTSEMTGDGLAGLIAPVLVLFSGGMGWWNFLSDAVGNAPGILAALLHPPRDYTIVTGTEWRWGNAITTLLIPQRSMLFGLCVAVVIFTQWWLVLKNDSAAEAPLAAGLIQRRMIAAGVLAGLLPLIHTHTWMVVMAMAFCLALLFRQWRVWLVFFAVALLLSGPQVLFLLHGSSVKVGTFWAWHFGWQEGEGNAIWFWLKNTGLFIPLLVAAVLWRGKQYLVSPRLLRFYVPFVLCFLIPNAIQLAPWVWDNIKVLFYWYLASVPLVALLLARLFRGAVPWRALGSALLLALTLAGALDVWRVISGTTQYREFDRDGMAIADQIVQHTEPRALILHAATFDTPVFLTGRRSLLGYPGWAWSRGLDPGPRESVIRQIYAGSLDAPALLQQYGVTYIMVGPHEQFYTVINYQFLRGYRKVAQAGGYRLYQVEPRGM